MVKQVKPLEPVKRIKCIKCGNEFAETGNNRNICSDCMRHRLIEAEPSKISGNFICCLFIIIIVAIFLLAGGWQIVLGLLYALAGGW